MTADTTPQEELDLDNLDWTHRHTFERNIMWLVLSQFEEWLKRQHIKKFTLEHLQQFKAEIMDGMSR